MRLRPRFFLGGVIECSSRMKANFQVRFLEGWRPAMASGHSAKRFEENRGNRKLCHLSFWTIPDVDVNRCGLTQVNESGAASTKVTELTGHQYERLYTLTLPSKTPPYISTSPPFLSSSLCARHENGGRILHLRRIRHGDLNSHLFPVRISAPKADSALRHIKACHDVRPKLHRFHTGEETHSRPSAAPPLEARVPR